MKVDVTTVGSFQKQLTVVVPPNEVRSQLDRAYKILAKQVRLPGFRQGRAPRNVLEAQYGERIQADVMQELIQSSWTDILSEGELEPVSQPSIADSGPITDADGFRFTITVDVRPDIELQTWTELEVVYPKVEVTDEEVDRSVKARLEGHAKLEVISDRPCEVGDLAQVALTVVNDDGDEVANEMGTMIRTDGDPYYPGVEDLVIGLAVDAEATGVVTFAEDARVEGVAGQTLKTTAKVISLQSYQVPDATDEIAEELGYEGGATGMRAALQQKISDQRDEMARNQARANLLEAVIAANVFDVPQGMVEQSLRMLMEELRLQQSYQTGRDPKTIGFSDAQVNDLRMRSAFAAKASLILEWVAKKEGIEVADDDLDKKFQELADLRGQSIEAVRSLFSSDGADDDLRERILEEKTLDWMLERATLVDPPEVDPEAEAGSQTDGPTDAPTSSDEGESGLDLLKGSIDALKAALDTGDLDDQVDALLEAEVAGRNRKGALAAIEARRGATGA